MCPVLAHLPPCSFQLRCSQNTDAMKYPVPVLFVLLIAACLTVPSAARGGRGRGGGSVGGLFGGWRKYKKPSSGGSGRRVMNGSPVHTAMSVPKPLPPPPPPKPQMAAPRPQMASYPRQQLPPGYSYPAAGAGAQGTYYANAQALPAGAVFYAQPPMRSSGTGDFLTGMLAGHMMNSMLFGHRHRVVYQEPVPQAPANGRDIIVINNGEEQQPQPWPMATDVPPAPLNESLIPADTSESDEDSAAQVESASQDLHSTEAENVSAAAAPVPDGGIICFPIMLNETDTENPEELREVERIVCFPAPPNPQPEPSVECEISSYIEPDPEDPSKTIEVQRQECSDAGGSTTTTEPPIVAGDIGAGAAVEVANFVVNRASMSK